MTCHKERMSVNCDAVDDFAVTHVQDAMSVGGGIRVVSDHNNRLAQIPV